MHAAETLEEGLARVRAQVRGGNAGAAGNAADSDDELVTLSTAISLKCPMSGLRMVTPARCGAAFMPAAAACWWL